MQPPHQITRHLAARCNARPKRSECIRWERVGLRGDDIEFAKEHGGDTVEGGTAVFVDSMERFERGEGFGREDNARAVCCCRHVAQDAAEAMKERWWAADNVVGSKEHAILPFLC